MDNPRLTYRDAGVDRAAAERVKQRISGLATSTRTDAVVGDFGAFGGCFHLEPGVDGTVLVASADGVGTKLKVAVMAGVHDTVGYDLVAHCADDILAQGALPLFFLDYLALGEMDTEVVEQVVEGVARACREIGCALLGGETAEMPDMYAAGEYDLAGFIVGRALHADPLAGVDVRPGDRLLGLASNGLHTNGYSLVRRILFDVAAMDVHTHVPEWGRTIAEELLRPHRSYVTALRPALQRGDMEALAHVTGGGIPGNLPRVLPAGCGARLETTAWEVPAVFTTLARLGSVSDDDMWATFNMGIGMIAVVRAERVESLIAEWRQAGEEVFEIGEIVAGDGVER